jgi:phage/plasmid-associated DNA primase
MQRSRGGTSKRIPMMSIIGKGTEKVITSRKGKEEASNTSNMLYDGTSWVKDEDPSEQPRGSSRPLSPRKFKATVPMALRESSKPMNESVELDDIVNVSTLINVVKGARGKDTHVQYYPRQRFHLDDMKHTMFWNGYCKLTDEGFTPNMAVGEIIDSNNVPLVSDICLIFDEEPGDYSAFIVRLVAIYQEAIRSHVVITKTRAELASIVLDSKACELKQGGYMVSIRTYFPYVRVSLGFIKRIITNDVVRELDSALESLDVEPTNRSDRMVLSPFVQNSLPMYSSRSKSSDPPLTFYAAYNEIPVDELDERADYSMDLDLEEFFPLSLHNYAESKLIDLDELTSDIDDYQYWLPYILSVNYRSGISQVHTAISPYQSVERENINDTQEEEPTSSHVLDDDPKHMAGQLLPMLKSIRFTIEHYWLAVGRSLYNIWEGDDEGLEWWIRDSVASGKFGSEKCKQLWATWCISYSLDFCTIRTLAYFAMQDSPLKYKNWHSDWCRSAMIKATSCSDFEVAEAFYRQFWLTYTNSPGGRKWKWWRYVNHHWIEVANGADIMLSMSGEFKNLFQSMITKESRRAERLPSGDPNRQGIEALLSRLTVLVNKLNSGRFHNSVLAAAGNIFHVKDREFNQKRNKNYNLTGVGNGVIETTTRGAFFREGKPEDYITKFSNVRFNSKLSWKSPSVKKAAIWLKQCFMHHQLIEYFLRLCSSFLRSRNTDKIFVVFTGKNGDNSKSQIKKAIDMVFGKQYSVTIDESVLTESGRSGGPSPEIARADGAKIIWFVEPDEDSPLKNNKIKKYSGDDDFFARNCNENGGDIVPTFVPIIMCNKPPIIPKNEKAVKTRWTLLDFGSTWSANAPRSEEEQYRTRVFPMDRNFSDKLPEMIPAFMWMFVQKFKDYCDQGLNIPPMVHKRTAEYWEENDPYHLFTKESIQEVINKEGDPDMSATLTPTEVYRQFDAWYRDNLPAVKVPLRPTVISELSRRWNSEPDKENNVWYGIKLREQIGSL